MVKVKTIAMVAEKLNAPLDVVSRLFDFQTMLNEVSNFRLFYKLEASNIRLMFLEPSI